MKILFFASYKEQLDCAEEHWPELGKHQTVADVLATLSARGEPWASVLGNSNMLIAINQEMADASSTIKAGDELAFFPPVTGG